MKQCRIEKTFKMQESEYVGDVDRYVGGLYPDTLKDDMWYLMIGPSGDVPELKGLKPEGFTGGDEFEILDFDLQKMAEIRETALQYFVRIDGFVYVDAGGTGSFCQGCTGSLLLRIHPSLYGWQRPYG